MTIHVYEDVRGEWRWRLVAANGRIMADSSEGYVAKQGCLDALDTVLRAIRSGDVELDA